MELLFFFFNRWLYRISRILAVLGPNYGTVGSIVRGPNQNPNYGSGAHLKMLVSPRKSTRLNSGMHTSTTLVCVPLMPNYQVEVLPAWLETNYAIGTLYRLMLYSKLQLILSL